MTLEQMCCTSDQARRLRELGVQQRSYFYWTTLPHIIHLNYVQKDELWVDLIGSAFTSEELGLIIPWDIISVDNCTERGRMIFNYFIHDEDFFNPSEVQLRADMIIYCLENNIVSVRDVNKKINE